MLTPLTQKAKGIVAIEDGCPILGLKGPGTPLMVIPGSLKDCRTSHINWPMFARPCPFRPRHGFEESVPVYSWEAVINILQRAKSAEPCDPVELVLAPMLTGQVSAVATNAGVTWGRGNDGVTAGKDPKALFIPVKTSNIAWRNVTRNIVNKYDYGNFKIPEFPYLEIVEDHGKMCLVQVRDGPEQSEGVNHVVRKMKVQYVLKARSDIDLLAWEASVSLATKEKGVVIWAPNMSLASHFCVHGIESGVPVITNHEVKVGDVIQPTKNRTSSLGEREYKKIAALIIDTLTADLDMQVIDSQRNAVITAIATTQAQFCWGKEAHLLRLRGLSIAVLLKAVLASCAGEIRHWSSSDGPRNGLPTLYKVLSGVDKHTCRRGQIYKRVINGSFTFLKIKRALEATETDFGHRSWGRSFGGLKWAEVADTGIELSKTAESFCAQPCAAKWSMVVQSANRLINTSHNSGKCLTKWVDSHAMYMVSEAPTAGFLNAYVTQVALNMTDTGDKS